MSNVPNHQKGQSFFHQTPLNADEDELVNQSEIAPSCTPKLKPFCFPDNFTQTALIGQEVCQEISQPPCHLLGIFPLKCLVNFDTRIKKAQRLSTPHTRTNIPAPGYCKSEICGTELCVAQRNAPRQWHRCCVHRHLGL